jgi:hypothetical protein
MVEQGKHRKEVTQKPKSDYFLNKDVAEMVDAMRSCENTT